MPLIAQRPLFSDARARSHEKISKKTEYNLESFSVPKVLPVVLTDGTAVMRPNLYCATAPPWTRGIIE